MKHSHTPELPGALIFDMNGTMIDDMPVHAHCWTELLRDNGMPMTLKEYWKHEPGGTAQEVIRGFLGDSLTEAQVDCLVEQKEFLYRTLYRKKLRLLPGLKKLLKEAKKAGLPVAIATAAGRRNIDFVVDILEIRDKFGAIVGAEDVQRGKPAPDLYLLAAEKLGIEPSRCIVFEDSQAGFEGAKRAGMPVIAISTTHLPEALLKREGIIEAIPDYRDVSLKSIAKLWKKHTENR